MRKSRLARASVLGLCFTLIACEGPGVPPESDASVPVDAPITPPPQVSLSVGSVTGTRGEGYLGFTGIPYAEAPVDALRWASPVAHPGWSTPIAADSPPSACPQDALGLVAGGSEDCLYVNVHTPDPIPANAPVLVWLHGGGFVFGEGLQLDRGTAGDILASRYGVVVVSVNYRLGVFGFMHHPELSASGNQGFEDQQLALRWVRDHAASFGGDPSNVTIFGESAGGLSVCLHMIAPGSRGLFARAISQSGLCDSTLPLASEQDAVGIEVATALGCDTASDVAACMRAATTDEVKAAGESSLDVFAALTGSTGRRFWPMVDGTVIPGSFGEQVRAGESADVPSIFGWNADEGTLFVGLAEFDGAVIDAAAYETSIGYLATRTGADVEAIRAAYPIADYADPGAALAAALGHATLACPSRRAAGILADAGRSVRVYRFEFDQAGFQLRLPRETLGAFHSAEIQFVFGHPSMVGRRIFVGEPVALHHAMSARWARFATSGDPEGVEGSPWPAYDTTSDRHVVLDLALAEGTGADSDACALWDAASLP